MGIMWLLIKPIISFKWTYIFSILQVHQTALEDDIGMMYLSTVDSNTVAVCTTDGHVTYVDDRNHPQQQT